MHLLYSDYSVLGRSSSEFSLWWITRPVDGKSANFHEVKEPDHGFQQKTARGAATAKEYGWFFGHLRGEKDRELVTNAIKHSLILNVLVGISNSAEQQHGNTSYSGNQRS
jgi:hypothetical protein